jgi:hypothetical protein
MVLTVEAGDRIRAFTRGMAVLSAVVALATVAAVVLPAVERQASDEVRRPWEAESAVDAAREPGGSVWGAEGSARIVLPEELRGRPIELRVVEADDDGLEVLLGDASAPDDWPRYLGSVWEGLPLPAAVYADSVLWVTTEHAWRMEVAPLEPTPLDSAASGDTDAVLVYTGAATGGTVGWSGEGLLFVVVRTLEGYDASVVSGDGDPAAGATSGRERVDWTASPFVVIEVSAYDGIRWTIELDDAGPDATGPPASGEPTSGVEGGAP